jgi:hypothetical protein
MYTRILLTLAAVAFILVPSLAEAQLDCMIPTRERVSTLPGPTSPVLAPFRRLVIAAEEIVKRNEVFLTGVRPIRVRTTIDYDEARPRAAIVNTVAYNEGAWVTDRCAVIPQADRGGGISDGGIHLVINDPRSFLGAADNDGVLESFQEPVLTGQVGGFPEYGGMYILIGAPNIVPWIPVTVAEALDREARRLARVQADWAGEKTREWLTEEKIQQSYELMKKIDAAAAETNRTAMLGILKEEQVRRPKMEAARDVEIAAQLDDLRTYRASFSTEQLQTQARMGVFPNGTARVDDPNGRPLVKVDPALASLDPNRIHFIRVFASGVPTDPVPGRFAWLQRSRAAIDLAALYALIQ